MKTLVAYYSRTGTTKKIAEAISRRLECDIEEIIDMKDRKGSIGYILAARDAATKRLTEIKSPEKDSSLYDIVLIGTPVWAFTTTPAVRTYLTANKNRFKKVAFFCTQGGAGSKRAFKDMEEISGRRPHALLEITEREVAKEAYMSSIEKFIYAVCTISD